MAYLRSLDDQIQIQIQEGQNLLLGRMLKCDVVLEDNSVSSQHARLKYDDGVLRVIDMGSTNGTRLNYAQVSEPVYVLDGDTVEFGNVSFTVDGPELQIPPESAVDPKAMTSLEPIDASQQLDHTMPLPDVDAEEAATATEQVAVPAPPSQGDPVKLAFALALILMLAAGALILAGISSSGPGF